MSHRQPPPVERARTKHDAEVERQRVIEEFAASLVAVRVLTYPRRNRKPENVQEKAP